MSETVVEARPNCERWVWIELIGFDNTLPDYGVAVYLDRCGFVPEGMCLLFSTPDFYHTHEGLEREVAFPPDYCSYAGKSYNAERQRQVWTNWQLKGLVDELHLRGLRVFPTMFNLCTSLIDNQPYRSPWCASHPELMETFADARSAQCLSPLKRLADGRYYEDVFVTAARAVVDDYGFDGLHAADGYSSPRHPLSLADYSDDMVEQFTALMGLSLPTFASMQERADYIWANLRHQWCEFYARRFEQFFAKVCAAMHETGREVLYNNAWTRDPFEAYCRYGVDYHRIAAAGVDRFILETVGAGVSIGAESGYRADLRFDLNFMVAFTKALLPQLPLLCLNATGDTTENWDVLNHAPTVSEREIYTLGSMFVQTSGESERPRFVHASTGPLVCLGDGINPSQWQWLRENWLTAYECVPQRVLGATVVWSEAALEGELEDYLAHRLLTRQKIAAELQKRGAPLQAVIGSANLAAAEGCLLVPRPELLPADELQRVLDYNRGPVVMIGRAGALPAGGVGFAEGEAEEQLGCRIYNARIELPPLPPVAPVELPAAMPDPPNYLHELYMRPVSEPFMAACTQLLIELTDTPRVVSGVDDLRVLAYEVDDRHVRVLVGNEAHFYVLGRLDMRQPVKSVRIASHFPGKPIFPEERFLDVRVPPCGMIVLDVERA